MYPKNLIIEQIERFFDLLEKVDSGIAHAKSESEFKLLEAYFVLTSKVTPKIMDSIDSLKCQLDDIEAKIKD